MTNILGWLSAIIILLLWSTIEKVFNLSGILNIFFCFICWLLIFGCLTWLLYNKYNFNLFEKEEPYDPHGLIKAEELRKRIYK